MSENAVKLMYYLMESKSDVQLVLTKNGVIITNEDNEGIVIGRIEDKSRELLGV
jgi:hypothetical protein